MLVCWTSCLWFCLFICRWIFCGIFLWLETSTTNPCYQYHQTPQQYWKSCIASVSSKCSHFMYECTTIPLLCRFLSHIFSWSLTDSTPTWWMREMPVDLGTPLPRIVQEHFWSFSTFDFTQHFAVYGRYESATGLRLSSGICSSTKCSASSLSTIRCASAISTTCKVLQAPQQKVNFDIENLLKTELWW